MMKQCRRICIGAATGIHLLYQRCWRSCTTSRNVSLTSRTTFGRRILLHAMFFELAGC